jgi:Dolichyl-phosphate-mannose-protein mannosyltransferase
MLAIPWAARGRALPDRDTGRRAPPVRWNPTDHFVFWCRDALAIFGLALGLRVVFSLLMANTFDKDEFVYLALGRAVGSGATPYRDFAFFHPPGILVLLGFLNPLTALWWPMARVLDVLLDSGTAVLVWRVGLHLYDRRAARAAGLLYAVNPVVLVSAVRVDQEIVITVLSMAGLVLLLTKCSRRTAVLAGACLAVACWVKYPAIVFLPIYLLAAPRRIPATVFGFLGAGAALFFPFLGEARQFFYDTVTWQFVHRYHTPLFTRLQVTAIFWLAISPFAIVRMFGRRRPLWLLLGFATGGVFVVTSSAYPHYFVPVAPYAALLGAPVAVRVVRMPKTMLTGTCLALTAIWAAIVLMPTSRQFIPASMFSEVRPIVQLIDSTTSPDTAVLADRFEYAYLAQRPSVAQYFWDQHDLVTAHELEQHLRPGSIVVLYPQGDLASFPVGLAAYLDGSYSRILLHGVALWSGDEVADRLGD